MYRGNSGFILQGEITLLAIKLHLQHPQSDGVSLKMRGIVKRFGATVALGGVDMEARGGEIHALLGENGAGKSTLMHVLTGLTAPDAGEILLDGAVLRLRSPRSARAHGLAMVHQHFTLVPAFTVAENLALDDAGAERRGGGRLFSSTGAAAPALERARALGWELDAGALVSDLPVGTQQRVEIVKALATNARVLIFDEPTAVLSAGEVEELFAVLRRLREEGRAVVLIAHKLAEILAVADRVTVLRHGSVVASATVADTNANQLAAWMVGEELPSPTLSSIEQANDKKTTTGPFLPLPKPGEGDTGGREDHRRPALSAENLVVSGDRGEEALRGLSLEVARGEILGIGGVDGNGQTELAETLAGLRVPESGRILWEDGTFRPGERPRVGYIPQDRRHTGLALTLSVEENLLFDAAREPVYRRGPFLRRKALRALAHDLIRQYDVRTPNPQVPASALSGGNQQKIVVARALRSEPELIVAVSPTRGLDIHATRFVHERLREARARGAAVVLISTDLDELAALADRKAILSGGRLTDYTGEGESSLQLGLLLGGLGNSRVETVETAR